MDLGGLSLSSLGSGFDTDTAKNLLKGIKTYMFQGPASVGKVGVSMAGGWITAPTSPQSRHLTLASV